MRTFITLLFLAAPLANGAPTAPSAEFMAEWVKFSKPVTLVCTKTKADDRLQDGKAIWIAHYGTQKQALESFSIAVYERGSYLRENRAKLEELISKAATDLQGKDAPNFFRVETRTDGRKVFFSLSGMGPGGSEITGFTSLPDCDLVVSVATNSEDGEPADRRVRNPATPTNNFSTLFQKIETYLLSTR